MSKLAEFRRAERELQEQLAHLEKLKTDASLQREMVFEEQLKALMDEYGMNLQQVIDILDPQPAKTDTPVEPKGKRRPRQVRVYVQPFTGKRIEIKSANNAQLKAWKAEFGAEVVEGWLQL